MNLVLKIKLKKMKDSHKLAWWRRREIMDGLMKKNEENHRVFDDEEGG